MSSRSMGLPHGGGMRSGGQKSKPSQPFWKLMPDVWRMMRPQKASW